MAQIRIRNTNERIGAEDQKKFVLSEEEKRPNLISDTSTLSLMPATLFPFRNRNRIWANRKVPRDYIPTGQGASFKSIE